MSIITFIERLLKYKLLILVALTGAAYLLGQPTASALQPSPGQLPNGAKYSCDGCAAWDSASVPNHVYTLGALAYDERSAAGATIDNPQPSRVEFQKSQYSAGEAAGAVTIVVTLSAPSQDPVTVTYASDDASAKTPGDYSALSGTLTFAPGQTNASFQAPLAADTLDEADETFGITLSNPTNAALGVRSATEVTILNDSAAVKPSLSIVADDPAAAEAGRDAASFTITRRGDRSVPLQVDYVLAGTAKAGSDYTPLAGSVKIPAGAASAKFALTPIDDAAVEGAETVIVTLRANSAYQVIAPSSATATIADDDEASQVVRFYIDDPSASEAGPEAGRFTIARDGSTAAALTVYYTISGTATPGVDYLALAGSVTIPAGQSSVAIDLVPIDDKMVEQTEVVVLALSPRASYSIDTPASATVTIADNDITTPSTPAPAPDHQIYLPIVARG